jgi:hypothetical protein
LFLAFRVRIVIDLIEIKLGDLNDVFLVIRVVFVILGLDCMDTLKKIDELQMTMLVFNAFFFALVHVAEFDVDTLQFVGQIDGAHFGVERPNDAQSEEQIVDDGFLLFEVVDEVEFYYQAIVGHRIAALIARL